MKRFYLDHNATTPLDSRVFESMRPWLEETSIGNPSSIHSEGRKARAAIDFARDQIAHLLKIKSSEIIFTGGGTESNNLALLGLARAHQKQGKHLITSAGEHHAVLHALEYLRDHEGFDLTILPLESTGRIRIADLEKAIRPDTILVSILSSNNETGVKSPMNEIGLLCESKKVLFHTDAVQSAGKEYLDFKNWKVTALSFTAHKLYGPQGIGFLYLKAGTPLQNVQIGGSQENQRRPGTENVAGIVGITKALELIEKERAQDSERIFKLTEKLWDGIADLPGIQRNGDPLHRLPNTLNVSFQNRNGEELLMGLDLEGISVSSGSACMVGSIQASHVLLAMNVNPSTAQATIRFSLGKSTVESDLETIVEKIRRVVLSQSTQKT